MKPLTPTTLQIYLRYARYLLWEFRWPLSVFTAVVLVGGLFLRTFYHQHGAGFEGSYVEACYAVFLLIFMELSVEFPDEWYLQAAFFLLPVVGLGAVADSIVRLGYLVLAQKRRLPEWHRMVASLFHNHIVVVGVGKLGSRVIKELVAMGEPVVAVEQKKESPFVDEIQDLGVPVITGNGRQGKTLEQAGVKDARSIVLATDDDLANLDAALTARDLKPSIRVVLRLFDDTLAQKVGAAFHMPALSTSRVAAPAFIAAATERKVYQDFELDGQRVHLTDLTIRPAGSLAGVTVGQIQADRVANIVMHRGRSGVSVNPGNESVLEPNDTVLVIAPIERLRELEEANQRTREPAAL